MAIGKLPRDLQKELEKAVRNFNSKVARLERKANYEDIVYPERVTVSQIKKRSREVNDLKEQIKDLKKFSQRGAEKPVYLSNGAKVTEYEWNLYKRNYQRARRNIEARIEKMKTEYPTLAGQRELLTYAQKGDRRYLNLVKKQERIEKAKLTRTRNKKEIQKIEERRKRIIEKGKSLTQEVTRQDFLAESEKVAKLSKRGFNPYFKKEFLEILDKLEYSYKLDPDKVEVLRNAVTMLTPEAWSKLYGEEELLKALKEYYEEIGEGDLKAFNRNRAELQRILNSLVDNADNIFGRYLQDESNFDKRDYSILVAKQMYAGEQKPQTYALSTKKSANRTSHFIVRTF